MKIKIAYFFQKNKQKIILITLFLSLVLIAAFVYHILFKLGEDEELVVIMNDDEEVLEEVDVKQQSYYVDIKGEVKKPGVYVLEEGKRVIDVIKEAGGLTDDADTSVNNLSRKIEDEMVIIIYSKTQIENFSIVKEEEENLLNELQKEEDKSENNALLKEEEIELSINKNNNKEEQPLNQETTSDGKISINEATKEELMTLSGIGEKKAEAIISYREEHGRFTKLEELLNVDGIGEAIFNQIKDSIKL